MFRTSRSESKDMLLATSVPHSGVVPEDFHHVQEWLGLSDKNLG